METTLLLYSSMGAIKTLKVDQCTSLVKGKHITLSVYQNSVTILPRPHCILFIGQFITLKHYKIKSVRFFLPHCDGA